MRKILKRLGVIIINDWIAILSIICFILSMTYLSIGEDNQMWNLFYYLVDSIWKLGLGVFVYFQIYNKGLKRIFLVILGYLLYGFVIHIIGLFSSDLYLNIIQNGDLNKFIYMIVMFSIFVVIISGAFFITKIKKPKKNKTKIYE